MKKLIVFTLSMYIFWGINAQDWQSMGTGVQSGVNAMEVFDSLLWVGGQYTSVNSMPSRNIAQWNGSQWIPITNGFDWGTDAMIVYRNQLYVGGEYDSVAGKPIRLIARLNGNKWDSVGIMGLAGNNVTVLDTFNNKLYAGGWFGAADGFLVNNIACWDGTKWDSLKNGVGTVNYGQVNCMCVYKGILYIGGGFDTIDRMLAWNFAGWAGTKWTTFGKIVDNQINCMTVYKGDLYIGGYFDSAGSVKVYNIACWDGVIWSDVGGGIGAGLSMSIPVVYTLSVYDGELYAGGSFYTAGGTPVHNIARWNGSIWTDVDTGVRGGPHIDVGTFCVYDSSLYIGGNFDSAGGLLAKNIARWTAPIETNVTEQISGTLYNKLYPNPNNGKFIIDIQNDNSLSLEIYNILGEKVYSQITNGNAEHPINLNSQPSGLYFYRIVSEGHILINEGKFIILK